MAGIVNSFIDAFIPKIGTAGAYALYLHLEKQFHLNSIITEIRELPVGYREWITADDYTVRLQEYRFEYADQQVMFYAGVARVTNTLYWWTENA